MNRAIWWIRRDLRLADNQALSAAQSSAEQVIPLFIIDPTLLSSPYAGDRRIAFLMAGLEQLERDLKERGSRLIVRQGSPDRELARLIEESGAKEIYAEADVSPYAQHRDRKIQAEMPLRLTGGLTVQHPDLVTKAGGQPYTIFTPFSRAWRALPQPRAYDLLPAPERMAAPEDLISLTIPIRPAMLEYPTFPPGEAEARERLAAFAGGKESALYAYEKLRNRPDLDATSRLSPYLRFGMISARTTTVVALEAIEKAPNSAAAGGAATWLNELIWREFFIAILYHFPHVRRGSFRSQYDQIAWNNDHQAFEAWCQGQTGYPLVDAAMRQLQQIGWMHNRSRMIVASFLVKDLLIDWRWGEKWFMQQLIDGDPAANNGGWQWSAGTGTDAAPYFRIFNPVLQSVKFDPQGNYIRRWLHELAGVPNKYIHEPWKMPLPVQRQTGCQMGVDYPWPTVDHQAARERTLQAYKATGEQPA